MRAVAAGLAICITLGVGVTAAEAAPRACSGFEVKRSAGVEWRHHRVSNLIRCVFAEVGIAGETSMALAIAERESSMYPWAWNRSSDCRGLFQHMGRYWRGRAIAYLPLHEFPHRSTISAFNARANTWAAAVMVRRSGWGAWSTA